MKRKRIVYYVLFGAYCILMTWLLFGREPYFDADRGWDAVVGRVNLQPFRTVCLYINVLTGDYSAVLRRSAVVNLAGNVVMFLPLGFLLPMLWRAFRRLWKTLLWGGLTIICVELIQLFALVGSCDVDDLLLNLVGIAMGYGLCRLFVWRKAIDTF